MLKRPAKLILIAVALILGFASIYVASRTTLQPPIAGNAQHGLASQPAVGSASPQNASSLAALTQEVTVNPPSDIPFSPMPLQSSPLAPDFQLTALDGKTVKLSDAVKNGPVLLDFWAIWCKPCRMEMPMLGTVYANYKSQGLQVYGINYDSPAAVQKHFFQEGSPGYPMLCDTGAVVHNSFNISAIPALFLIDRSGRVRSAFVGFDPNTQADLSSGLDQLLSEHPQKTL